MMRAEILEVGPRDGLQNEDKVLDVDTRVELINRLASAGVQRMEAVSFVHPDRVPQMAHAEEIMTQVPQSSDISYIGLVLNRRGAERAVETSVQELNIVVPVTDTFAMRNQGKTVEHLLAEAADSVHIAKEAGRFASVTLAVSFGCPFEGEVSLERMQEILQTVLEMGCDEIAFADTIGVGGSRRVREFTRLAKSLFGVELLRFHFHNTRNTGYSNAVTAVSEAAALDMPVVIDSSIGGFGGCPFAPAATGNIATEDILYGFSVDEISVTGSLDPVALIEHAGWLSLQLNKPVQSLVPKAGWFPA